MRLYFRDVLDHALRVNESTDTLREMLTAAMSVNLSLVTCDQGEVVKRLAGWAALLAAPTLITSWYGMNFDTHAGTRQGRCSYPILIGGVALVCGGCTGCSSAQVAVTATPCRSDVSREARLATTLRDSRRSYAQTGDAATHNRAACP